MFDDFVGKVIELADKFAGAIFLVTAVVLLLPEPYSTSIGIDAIRSAHRGYLWILLMFSGVLFLRSEKASILRFAVYPFLKLFFPKKDIATGLKQSRMRYRRVKFSSGQLKDQECYQSVNSNGIAQGYYTPMGVRLVPTGNYEYSTIANCDPRFPPFRNIDWSDIFNGERSSGCYLIENS